MRIVIKIGGSMTFDENGPKINYLRRLMPVIKQLKRKNQVIISIGGGKYGRNYIKNLKGVLPNDKIEWVFIDLLKANARLLGYMFDLNPLFSLKEIKGTTTGVISGLLPGHSTDWGAVMAAKRINADMLIKLTNVPYIYDKDPRKYKDAKPLKKIAFADLHKIKTETSPGHYGILDPTAINVISKNKIKTVVMSGNNPKDILNVIKGKKIGTTICD